MDLLNKFTKKNDQPDQIIESTTFGLYAVRDEKAKRFHLPFYARSENEALRSFNRMVQDPQSFISHYPEDFSLYALGTYSEHSGALHARATPTHVCPATDHVKNQSNAQPN